MCTIHDFSIVIRGEFVHLASSCVKPYVDFLITASKFCIIEAMTTISVIMTQTYVIKRRFFCMQSINNNSKNDVQKLINKSNLI